MKANATRGPSAMLPRHRHRLVHQRVVVHHPGDDAEPQRLLGVELRVEVVQLARLGRADQPGQRPGAAEIAGEPHRRRRRCGTGRSGPRGAGRRPARGSARRRRPGRSPRRSPPCRWCAADAPSRGASAGRRAAAPASARVAAMRLTSPPAQKPRPAPVSTMAPTAGSRPSRAARRTARHHLLAERVQPVRPVQRQHRHAVVDRSNRSGIRRLQHACPAACRRSASRPSASSR